MAAAPSLVVDESRLASPELALVDAELAAELRRSLSLVEDTWLRPRAPFEESPAAIEEDAPVQRDFADELGEAESVDVEHFCDDEHAVEVIERMPARSQGANSHYPVLPAPTAGEEAIEETDAALRRIRERLSDESPACGRKVRRRFTFASGASAVCALAVLALDVQLQLAQLASWLRF